MANSEVVYICKSCGSRGIENYCSQCGQPFIIKRISMKGLLHDIFHFFTHLDKGFGYTLKTLIIAPGLMQRLYVEGERSKHQKPFSMFFICASIAALSRYWIYEALFKYYHLGNISEAAFFHEYMVLVQMSLLPFHALITYLFFYKAGYNYAETGVMTLYLLSVLFLIATIIALFKFIWPEFDTAYVELPVFLVYSMATNINFFHKQKRWLVVLKTLIILIGMFMLTQIVEDFIVQLIT